MDTPNDILEAMKLMLDTIEDAQKAAAELPGNNWELRRALLECADRAIIAKRYALHAASGRTHAPH